MEIKPIKTEADYQAALAEIERLFDVAPGTPEADRLEVWTTLVEAYEEKHYPIPEPDPVEAIEYHVGCLISGVSRRYRRLVQTESCYRHKMPPQLV
jgi:HTH-type transcriptional regulator/antitoxin HigA